MQLTITNLTSSPVYIRDLYTSVLPGFPVVTSRTAAQVQAMTGLQEAVVAATVSYALVPSATDTASQVYQVIDVSNPNKLKAYTTAGRPVSTTMPVSSAIWNTDTDIPNFADGAVWRDAAGAVV
jgi:hypothetical protein